MRLVPDYAWAVITIFQEAEGEPYEGKVAVAEVILRRAKQKYNSDGTIVGTVLRKYQFSGWNTDSGNRIRSARIDDTDPAVKDCIRAWAEAKAGSNFTNGAVLYYNPRLCNPLWARNAIETAVVGNHRFMKEGT